MTKLRPLFEEAFQLRTKEVHDYHLQALQTDAKNGPVFGVMHRCPLHDLLYINASETFVPDIMHGLLDIVIPGARVSAQPMPSLGWPAITQYAEQGGRCHGTRSRQHGGSSCCHWRSCPCCWYTAV